MKGGPVFCGFRSCVVLADPSPPSHLLEIIQGSCSHAIQEPTIDRDQLCLLRMTPTAAQVSPLKVFDVLLVVPFGCMSGLISTVLVVQAPTPEKRKKKKKKCTTRDFFDGSKQTVGGFYLLVRLFQASVQLTSGSSAHGVSGIKSQVSEGIVGEGSSSRDGYYW